MCEKIIKELKKNTEDSKNDSVAGKKDPTAELFLMIFFNSSIYYEHSPLCP